MCQSIENLRKNQPKKCVISWNCFITDTICSNVKAIQRYVITVIIILLSSWMLLSSNGCAASTVYTNSCMSKMSIPNLTLFSMFGVSLWTFGRHWTRGMPTKTTTRLRDDGLYTKSPQTGKEAQYFSMCWAMAKPFPATWYPNNVISKASSCKNVWISWTSLVVNGPPYCSLPRSRRDGRCLHSKWKYYNSGDACFFHAKLNTVISC